MEHPPKQGLKLIVHRAVNSVSTSFNGTSTKTRIETALEKQLQALREIVLMEHPPKQGLKLEPSGMYPMPISCFNGTSTKTRIETSSQCLCHKLKNQGFNGTSTKTRIETNLLTDGNLEMSWSFNGTSTKTRIETRKSLRFFSGAHVVLMEHPPKQGLKLLNVNFVNPSFQSFNGTSTKTRIETLAFTIPVVAFK